MLSVVCCTFSVIVKKRKKKSVSEFSFAASYGQVKIIDAPFSQPPLAQTAAPCARRRYHSETFLSQLLHPRPSPRARLWCSRTKISDASWTSRSPRECSRRTRGTKTPGPRDKSRTPDSFGTHRTKVRPSHSHSLVSIRRVASSIVHCRASPFACSLEIITAVSPRLVVRR